MSVSEPVVDSPLIPRFITLLEAGYVLNQSGSKAAGVSLWLEHPAKRRFTEWMVFLDADGYLRGWQSGRSDHCLRVPPEDRAAFRLFVSTVPRANWWERYREARYTFFAWALFIAISLSLGSVFKLMLKWVVD